MGTSAAIEYANINMYSIEYSFVDKYNPTLYLRYIDDLSQKVYSIHSVFRDHESRPKPC